MSTVITTIGCLASVTAAALLAAQHYEAEPVVEQVSTTTFMVDGVTCWVGNYPTMTYDPTDFTVKLTITCTDEVVWHYLPAIERTQ